MNATAAVLDYLERRGVGAALIGGVALGFHGVARATLDSDVLVADRATLTADFWRDLSALPPPQIRLGDADDPLLGVIRFESADGPVDVVAIAGNWVREVVDRRIHTSVRGQRLAVVDRADLIVLKLYAGGPQDLLDVQLLLQSDDRDLPAEVEARIAGGPASARSAWAELRKTN